MIFLVTGSVKIIIVAIAKMKPANEKKVIKLGMLEVKNEECK